MIKKMTDYEGKTGKCWQIDFSKMKKTPDDEGTVSMILLFCAHAHPFWCFWLASLVHLREIPGARLPTKHFSTATHEITIFSLDPRHDPPEPDNFIEPFYPLEPADQVVQFAVPSDAAASAVLDYCVKACCDGMLSPDQDYRRAWAKNVELLAEHQRGEHGGGGVCH